MCCVQLSVVGRGRGVRETGAHPLQKRGGARALWGLEFFRLVLGQSGSFNPEGLLLKQKCKMQWRVSQQWREFLETFSELCHCWRGPTGRAEADRREAPCTITIARYSTDVQCPAATKSRPPVRVTAYRYQDPHPHLYFISAADHNTLGSESAAQYIGC